MLCGTGPPLCGREGGCFMTRNLLSISLSFYLRTSTYQPRSHQYTLVDSTHSLYAVLHSHPSLSAKVRRIFSRLYLPIGPHTLRESMYLTYSNCPRARLTPEKSTVLPKVLHSTRLSVIVRQFKASWPCKTVCT